MSEKKRITILCNGCNEKFTLFREPKGVLLITCPYCKCELKIEFEENRTVELYRSKKVK